MAKCRHEVRSFNSLEGDFSLDLFVCRPLSLSPTPSQRASSHLSTNPPWPHSLSPGHARVYGSEATREEARLAVELVSEYLSEAWAVKLQHRCGFSEEEMRQGAGAKKRSAWDGDGDLEQGTAMALTQGKRGKGGGEGGREGPGGPGGEPGGAGGMRSAQGGQSLAQKKLAKTNLKGVKSISSFFGKKAKA